MPEGMGLHEFLSMVTIWFALWVIFAVISSFAFAAAHIFIIIKKRPLRNLAYKISGVAFVLMLFSIFMFFYTSLPPAP